MSAKKELISYDSLSPWCKELVDLAWKMSRQAYCPYSHFPVGAAILARDAIGVERVFGGCNVENASYGGTICAERTAAVKAVSEGYTRFLMVAVVCAKAPGGSPCGLCRQVIREFGGTDAIVLNISNTDSAVTWWTMEELLPDSFGPEALQPQG